MIDLPTPPPAIHPEAAALKAEILKYVERAVNSYIHAGRELEKGEITVGECGKDEDLAIETNTDAIFALASEACRKAETAGRIDELIAIEEINGTTSSNYLAKFISERLATLQSTAEREEQ